MKTQVKSDSSKKKSPSSISGLKLSPVRQQALR